MATPPDTNSTNKPAAEAAGAYRDPKAKSSNPLPWILGLLALLVLVLLVLWAVGVFDDDDDEIDEIEPGETLPTSRLIVPAAPVCRRGLASHPRLSPAADPSPKPPPAPAPRHHP